MGLEADIPLVSKLREKTNRFFYSVLEKQRPHWLSLLGRSGTGKTHCARWLWSVLSGDFDFSKCAYSERIIYWPQFVDELRDCVKDGLGMEPLRDLMTWPFLVLDDIGSERDSTGFASEKLNMLIARRVGKWTVITSNLMLDGLSKVDDRVADRIVREPGNDWIEMDCESYTARKAKVTI